MTGNGPVPEGSNWPTLEDRDEEEGDHLAQDEEEREVQTPAQPKFGTEEASVEEKDREARDGGSYYV